MTTLAQIAGSVFGLNISTDQCPILDPSGDPVDTSNWQVKAKFISSNHRFEVNGTWLSSTGPWTIFFEHRDTIAWLPAIYEVRLEYTEPAPDSRRFEVHTDLQMEVRR